MESKEMLISLLGEKEGTSLYGKAVVLSAKTGIDLDDVVQELAIASQKTVEKLGEYSEAYTLTTARNAMMNSSGYGVNWYYSSKGVSEEFIASQDDADEAFEILSDSAEYDLVEFVDQISQLTDDQRLVAGGLAYGWKAGEIAAVMGKSNSHVSYVKAQLMEIFADSVRL